MTTAWHYTTMITQLVCFSVARIPGSRDQRLHGEWSTGHRV